MSGWLIKPGQKSEALLAHSNPSSSQGVFTLNLSQPSRNGTFLSIFQAIAAYVYVYTWLQKEYIYT